MRRTPFIALLVGVVLLSAGLLAMAGSVAQERQQARTLQRDAAQVASAFTSYFERARSLDLLLAQSPAFRPPDGGKVDNAQANGALSYLERLYPGAIGEACLINDQGRELARVTQNVAAPVAELSSAEAQNPFFAPTLALDLGQVYQAAPYVSVDTGTWVISNSTWIRQADGSRLIVHFEVALASFRQYLTTSSTSHHVSVVDRAARRTVLSDDTDLPPTTVLAGLRQFPSTPAIGLGGTKPATIQLEGHPVAIGGVERTPGNANDWVIVERSTARESFIPLWVGGVATIVGIGLVVLFLIILRRQQNTLRMAARLDHLTGLPNRKALEEVLDDAVDTADHLGGDRIAVLMLDLDGFKQINDTLGHDKGDLVLQEIGRRLHANTFEYDTAARLGGDEFAVVLRQLRDADDVAAVAHRLREALVRPIDVDGVARFIGVSIGAAVYREHGQSSAELLRAADAAMYHAKRGREGVRVYDAGTAAGATASGRAAELLLAIENDQIGLAYQPEYALETGLIVGVEALARWRSGDTHIPPSEFIPLAEQTGLIRQLTHLTLRKALDEARVWHDAGVGVPVSVNLSAQLVTDRSLQADVSAMLAERQLRGESLVLEITETTIINDSDVAVDVLQGLRGMGVRIELDDFGSGYASFKALHELPLDGVKIDRDLVNDFDTGGHNLLAATIDIGRRLGLKVVAEGIENEAGLELVRRLGADTAQGYHLARPTTPEAVRVLLGVDRRVTTPVVPCPAAAASTSD
jgi:diguanylate cyclase (GGDEF)-like protein